MEKMLTLLDVQNILQITRRTLYNYIKDGKLKAVKAGTQWRVSEKVLNEFIENSNKKE